jgi:hypothetical protein
VLAFEVVVPVLVEVVIGSDGAEFQHCFGALGAPAGTGDVHAVLDEVSACAFDHAGGDRPSGRKRGRVVEMVGLVDEVSGCLVGLLAFLGG